MEPILFTLSPPNELQGPIAAQDNGSTIPYPLAPQVGALTQAPMHQREPRYHIWTTRAFNRFSAYGSELQPQTIINNTLSGGAEKTQDKTANDHEDPRCYGGFTTPT